MRRILQAKHWQIFLTLLALSFLQGLVDALPGFKTLFYIAYISCYVGWLLLLGTWLQKISPSPAINYLVFLVVGFALIAFIASFQIIAVVTPGITVALEDIQWLIGIGILASLVFLTGFVGKNLRAIEIGGQVDINDYFNDILSLIFWPIGIWMFQPRINRIEQRLSMQALGTYDEYNAANNLTPKLNSKETQRIRPEAINRLIGYGILVFVIGFVLGINWIKWVQLLMPVGSLMTFFGVFYFFKETNLVAEFKMNPKDDVLTYFWNVIVLKLWTFIFLVMMMIMNLKLIAGGLQ